MIKFITYLGSLLLFFNYASSQNKAIESQEIVQLNIADSIVKKAIEVHGGSLYDIADYSFVFREKEYRFTN